ncbi:MAG: histidine kinase [Eubacterium sp.]|nr:histidine kinase [Eubacterium sp.]
MNRKELSIREKLMFVMLFTLILIFVSNVIMFITVNSLMGRLNSVYESNVDINDLREALTQVHSSMYSYLEIRDYNSLQDYYRAEEDLKKQMESLNVDITSNPIDILEKNIKNMTDAFLETSDVAINSRRGMNIDEYTPYYDRAMEIYEYIVSDIAKLNQMLFEKNSDNYISMQRALGYLELSTVTVLSVILLIGIILMARMTNGIVQPLIRLANSAKRVGEGDFSQRVDESDTDDDEVGVVTHAFNGMVNSLNEYMIKVKKSAAVETELREKELMMENHLHEAQLKFLQAQINPHFLFNSLNAGVQLAEMEDDERTAVFLDRMAHFFRYNIKKGTEATTIGEELKMVDDYVYILNVRFAGEIKFIKEVDEEVSSVNMPSMILQPLVENSLNHGIRENLSEGWIKLEVINRNDFVEIIVSDNGKGMTQEQIDVIMGRLEADPDEKKETTGIGVGNVISRLKLYSGREDVIDVVSQGPGMGTEVHLYLYNN